MLKQRKIMEYLLKIKSKSSEPEIKVVRNTYMTAGGLIQEILIRKTYQSV